VAETTEGDARLTPEERWASYVASRAMGRGWVVVFAVLAVLFLVLYVLDGALFELVLFLLLLMLAFQTWERAGFKRLLARCGSGSDVPDSSGDSV
jgi:hypothetical protein